MSHTIPTEHLVQDIVPELDLPGVRKNDVAVSEVPIVAPPSYDEPVVTRRELWSYYRTCPLDVIRDVPHRSRHYCQYITTEITCVSPYCVLSEP